MLRDLILVSISLFLWGFGESAFFYFQPLYLQQLGANPLHIGVIISGYGIAAALAHIPAGYLADRLGRKPLVLAGWVVGTIATTLMAIANNLAFFTIGMILYGSTMFVISPLNSYVTVARGKYSVQRIITLVSVSFNLGAIIGPVFGGSIGENYGIRTIFWIAAFLFLVSTGIIITIRPQAVETHHTGNINIHLRTNKTYILFLIILFLATFAMYLPQPLAPNFLQNQRNLNLTQIGKLYAINGIGIVLINLTLGHLGNLSGFILGQLFVGAFALIIMQFGEQTWYAAAYFLLGGFRLARAMAVAYIQSLIHQTKIGLAYGIAETIGSLALILAPALAGYLYNLNPLSVFTTSVGIIVFSVLTSIIFFTVQNKFKSAPHPLIKDPSI